MLVLTDDLEQISQFSYKGQVLLYFVVLFSGQYNVVIGPGVLMMIFYRETWPRQLVSKVLSFSIFHSHLSIV